MEKRTILKDEFTQRRAWKKIEQHIKTHAEKDGYQFIIRLHLQHLFEKPITKNTVESFVQVLGILCRSGYMTNEQVKEFLGHLGFIKEDRIITL